MTETVRALCAWAKQQPGVRHITAETEPDNRASHRVLQRAGFHPAEADAARWLPPGKYRRPFLRTAFCIFVDPEASIRNSGFPGSGADSWQEKLIPTADRLPQIIRASP